MKKTFLWAGMLALAVTSAFGFGGFGPGGGGGSGASSIGQLSDWPAGVDATEVGYLNGVTSAIQDQFSTSAAADAAHLTVFSNYTTSANAAISGKEATQTAASQAEAEAGTEAAIRSFSPLRVAQAIAALGGAGHAAVTLSTDLGNNLLGLSTQQITLDNQTAAYVFAGPTTGDPAAPAFRALVSTDIPDLSGTYLGVSAKAADADTLDSHDTSYFQVALTDPIVAAGAQSITGAKTFDSSMLVLKGSSTGTNTFAAANSSASNYTTTVPAETGTLCTTGSVCSGYQAALTNPVVQANLGTGVYTALGNTTNSSGGLLTYGNAAGTAAILTGYTSGAGTVAATDTILQAIQKLNGNIAGVTATAINDIGDAAADGTIDQTGYKQTFTSTLNTAGSVWTMTNTTADLTADVSFLDLKYTDDGDANGYFLRGYDNAGGDLKFSVAADGAATFGAVTATSYSTGSTATPTLTLSDSDNAAGTGAINANSGGGANDIILTIGVEDSTGESTPYIEVDGVTETVDILKPLVSTGAITPAAANGAALGSATNEWSDLFLHDGAIIYGQADQSATLTSSASTWTASNLASTGSMTVGTSLLPDAADGATIGSATAEWSDIYVATGGVIYGENDQSNTMTSSATGFNFNLPIGMYSANDPDVAAEGKMGWDANGDWLRVHDGTNQVAVARKTECYDATVITPNDLADAQRDAFYFWTNNSGMSFIVTSWEGFSTTDDTTLNLEEIDNDGANNTTIDAVELATDGTGIYYGSDSTITAGTIETGHRILIDFDDTDAPGQVHMSICGYYNGDVN